MSKRLIRDWTRSKKVNTLSLGAEVFLLRLMMKADDYGSYYSDPKLLRADLYPRHLGTLRECSDDNILMWVEECITAGIVFTYTVDNENYIRIIDFGQRKRGMRNLFPDPKSADNCPQVAASRGQLSAGRGKLRPEIEVEVEVEDEIEIEGVGAVRIYNHRPVLSETPKAPEAITDLSLTWNTMPGPEAWATVLPPVQAGAALQMIKINKGVNVTPEQVETLWGIFKAQNFNGTTYYANAGKTFSHFINWCRLQNVATLPTIEKPGMTAQEVRGKAILDRLDNFKKNQPIDND